MKRLSAAFVALLFALSAHAQSIIPFGGGGSPGGSTGQVQYNNAGAFAGMAGTSWDNTNRSLTITGATVTTSNPVFNLTQTWNAGAVAFTGIKLNVTDTTSSSLSTLIDLQVGGVSKFSVSKNGIGTFVNGIDASTGIISRAGAVSFGASSDVTIRRSAPATLQMGAGDAAAPVAQTLSVQSVVAGTADTAGVNFTIKGSAGTGSAAGGSLVFQVAPASTSGSTQNAFVTALTIASTKEATFAGQVTVPGAAVPIIKTTATITSGAAGNAGTLTNAPAVGNPTSWIPINDNGVTRYIPAW